MFCQKCNLHYHDHLSFCRRCGQPLARSTSDHAVDSHCCTRCGARVVRGENFCQQCGNRIGVALQDTVIGACYHCGTSWRSGWLFCKNCGLDRKRALLLSTSSPSSTPLFASAKQNGAESVDGFAEIAKVNCQFCGAEAKPFSRFCESCGRRIDGSKNTDKPGEPLTVAPLNSSQPPLAKFNPPDDQPITPPAIFEPQPVTENEVTAQSSVSSAEPSLANNSPLDAAARIAAAPNDMAVVEEWHQPAATGAKAQMPLNSISQARIDQGRTDYERHRAHAGTVVTPIPPFARVPDEIGDSVNFKSTWRQNRSAILQSAVLLGLILLLGSIVLWWLWEDRQKVARPESRVQPTPATLPPNRQPSSASNSNQTVNPAPPTLPEGMVYVPGGKFEMGRANGDEYEKPAHTVTVEPFFIDRTEVTNEAYLRFVAATGHRAPAHWQNGKFSEAEAKLPVINVSWDDANAYAKWANKRLPTEAEWEFAARGTDGRLYPWGNTWNPAASNAGHGAGGHIVEVGSFPAGASPFGALDMCGNVWEWTASGLQSYSVTDQEIAPGKVIRGGAFDVSSARATATYRGVLPADRLPDKTGFRTVRDAPKP